MKTPLPSDIGVALLIQSTIFETLIVQEHVEVMNHFGGNESREGRNPLSSNKCRRAWSQDQLRPSPMPESAHTPSGAHTAQYRGRSVEGVREDAWRELCAQLVEDEDGAYLA